MTVQWAQELPPDGGIRKTCCLNGKNRRWLSVPVCLPNLALLFSPCYACPIFVSLYLYIIYWWEKEREIDCSTYLCIWLIIVCALTRNQTENLGIAGRCSNRVTQPGPNLCVWLFLISWSVLQFVHVAHLARTLISKCWRTGINHNADRIWLHWVQIPMPNNYNTLYWPF